MNKVTFVIGPTASGKTTFIKNFFCDKENVEILNVHDYQIAAYRNAGYCDNDFISFKENYNCLYQANEALLEDIIAFLRQGRDVVVEHTLFKRCRRIAYLDALKKEFKDITIELYLMCPGDRRWKRYAAERKINSFQRLKAQAEQIEFPNPAEGFDAIYTVTDGDIKLRMDEPDPKIIETCRKQLLDEAGKRREENEKIKAKSELLKSMTTRPFHHYCEVCGTKAYLTAQDATAAGWDYPPQIGSFGLLGPRTCGKCSIINTLWWKVQQQELPIVVEKDLTAEELKTWRRIKNEPESLLEEE